MNFLSLVFVISILTKLSHLQQSPKSSVEEERNNEFDEYREEDDDESYIIENDKPKENGGIVKKVEVSGAASSISLENLWEHILKNFLPDEVLTFEIPPRSQEVIRIFDFKK